MNNKRHGLLAALSMVVSPTLLRILILTLVDNNLSHLFATGREKS